MPSYIIAYFQFFILAFISSHNHLNLLFPHFHIWKNQIKHECCFFLIFYSRKKHMLFSISNRGTITLMWFKTLTCMFASPFFRTREKISSTFVLFTTLYTPNSISHAFSKFCLLYHSITRYLSIQPNESLSVHNLGI